MPREDHRTVHEDDGVHRPFTVKIARCREHGLHGERAECLVYDEPVEQIAMVPLDVHNEIYGRLLGDRQNLRLALLALVALYRDDTGEIVHTPGASEADDALALAVSVLYPDRGGDV
ncbi:MAG TPA: hypothetical protein VFZ00_28475 [Solirubrobacter sp.]|nr:hypothetical protein [Solirubrobacter sp.]